MINKETMDSFRPLVWGLLLNYRTMEDNHIDKAGVFVPWSGDFF